MNKKDVRLLLGVIVISVLLLILFQFMRKESGEQVEILIDGKVYGNYSLLEDQTIEVETLLGNNVVVIENGIAYMREADCPDQYCVQHKPISKMHETIVCLPHKLVVQMTGKEEKQDMEIDGIVQ